MKNMKQCNVFISSPGDLSKERLFIAEKLRGMNNPDILFNPIQWEKDLPNTSTSSAQNLIDEELLKNADILVGIFGTRFGSKTERSDSGTVEEIETFIAQGKPVILYFYNKNISTASISKEEIDNLQKIQEFKNKYKDKHIYSIINGLDDLASALTRDINYNLQYILSQSSTPKVVESLSQNKQRHYTTKKKVYPKNPWYMDSIADLINIYLKNKNIDFYYDGNITFHENLKFLTGSTGYTSFVEQKILEEARIDAFNKKYGNYDYSNDLRARYSTWGGQILDRILKLKPNIKSSNTSFRVLDIGGNDGSELDAIFGKCPNIAFSVVDISNVAIDRGKSKFQNIEFYQSDMESDYLSNVDLYDVCLCLRSIQSRGVFNHDAIIQMCKHIKKDGIILISIPNGYKHKEKVERGLYDHRSHLFLRTKPQSLALKVERKLIDYGFSETGIETIDTEVVVWGKGRGAE